MGHIKREEGKPFPLAPPMHHLTALLRVIVSGAPNAANVVSLMVAVYLCEYGGVLHRCSAVEALFGSEAHEAKQGALTTCQAKGETDWKNHPLCAWRRQCLDPSELLGTMPRPLQPLFGTRRC